MAVSRDLYFPIFLSLCFAIQTLSDLILTSVTASYYIGMGFYCLLRNGRAIWYDVFGHTVNLHHNFHGEIKYYHYNIMVIKLCTLINTEISNIYCRKIPEIQFSSEMKRRLTEDIYLFIHMCACHLCLHTP